MKNPPHNKTILETARLILKTWSQNDLAEAYEIFRDPEVMRYIGEKRPFDIEATSEFLEWSETYQQENGFCRWKILERSSGMIVGSCGFARPHGTEEIELGYLLRRDSWGRGFATEAAQACMLHGFNNLGFHEIIAMTDPENIASQKVLEKIGFAIRGIESYKGEENLVYFAENPVSIL